MTIVEEIVFYRKKLRCMGRWMAVRYMRNQGVPFDVAYLVIFSRLPRIIGAAA